MTLAIHGRGLAPPRCTQQLIEMVRLCMLYSVPAAVLSLLSVMRLPTCSNSAEE